MPVNQEGIEIKESAQLLEQGTNLRILEYNNYSPDNFRAKYFERSDLEKWDIVYR